jgi:hypothetical protein
MSNQMGARVQSALLRIVSFFPIFFPILPARCAGSSISKAKDMVEYAAVAGSASAAYAGNNAGDGALQPRPLAFGDGTTSVQANKTQAAFVPKLYS